MLEFIKSKIQEYTDLILGDGAFEKLYDVADEDLFVVEEGNASSNRAVSIDSNKI